MKHDNNKLQSNTCHMNNMNKSYNKIIHPIIQIVYSVLAKYLS